MKFMDVIVGGVLALYAMMLIIVWGNVSFSYILFFIGLMGVLHYFIKERLKKFKLYKWFKVMVCIFICFFMILEGAIIIYPKHNIEKSDYLLVLGAGVNGTTPSMTLKGRLDKTIEYVNEYDKNVNIIVSGGQGPGEDITEAKCMRDYLINNGISQENILVEDKSTSTGENFKFSKDVIERHSGRKVKELDIKVITNDFHSLRSNMLGERQGYTDLNFYTSTTNIALIPVYYIRESFAFLKSYFLD